MSSIPVKGKGRHSPLAFVEYQHSARWWCAALRAFLSCARGAAEADRGGGSGGKLHASGRCKRTGKFRLKPQTDREFGVDRAAHPRLRVNRAREREPAAIVFKFDQMRYQLAGAVERIVDVPQRAAAVGFDERRSAGSGKAFARLAGMVNPQHEEWQAAVADALQRGQAVGDLFKARAKAALQQDDVIAGGLARAQETGIGHHHRGGEIACQVAAIKSFACPVGEAGAADQRIDFGLRLDLGELERGGEGAAGGIEQFADLQLACVEVEAAEAVGHHVDGEDPDAELMLDPKPFADRGIEVVAGDAQFIGERFGLDIEIGEMVAPAFDLAPGGGDGFRLEMRDCRAAASAAVRAAREPVERPGKGLG